MTRVLNRELTRDAMRIFRAGLRAADPAEAVSRHLRLTNGVPIAGRRRYRLDRFRRILVVGAGKASAVMAQPIERLFGGRIEAGCINVKYGHAAPLRHIEINECGHPIPDDQGVAGAEKIAAIVQQASEDDLVICLISGGASALLPLPVAPVTLEDEQSMTRLLLACGANIHEMNCLRKHLSRLKGGRLAQLARSPVLALILSDVIGDDLDVIGSGPTVPDLSTFEQSRAIVDKYALWKTLPPAIAGVLQQANQETPKPGDPAFERVQNVIVGSNRLAIDAAVEAAKAAGYRTMVLSSFIEGETREVARMHAAILKEARASGRPVRPPACIVSGGETTVTIRGKGLGGRNQEFVLAAAIEIDGMDHVAILSAGTDGTDGPTDAAGAIATGKTVARAREKNMDAKAYLVNNDAYHFFEPLSGLIKTGPTRTNVMDIRLMLIA